MKKSIKDCLIVAIIGVIVGIIVFLLFNASILAINPNTYLFLLISMAASIYILVKLLKIRKYENIKDSYCYCGHLSAVGAAGVFIVAFLLSLFATTTGILLYAFIALYFLLLVFMVGGLAFLLYTMNNCHTNNCHNNCNEHPRYAENNHEDYNHNSYNRNNEYVYKERRR